ncbi:ABC transporter substrate-binding protein [Methanoculleus sp.]|uniref:ABC transporter substrate-binding protein n=1 Tax=Methanoculleus sp. TaxID=90427 RepID=UPI001BD65828|nr:cobalamin-binding protein [Methanoculleus sp.]
MERNRGLLFSLGLIIFPAMLIGAASASYADSYDGQQQTGYASGGGDPNTAQTLEQVTTGADERIVTVTDDYGETVTVLGTPQRIVSLAPSNTEILYALDLGDRIVGVTDNSDYPSAAADKPKVGGYSIVNIEKVIATEPDLIFAASGNTEEVIGRLRSLGMTVITLNPQTVGDVLQNIELVGRATGQEEQASACVERLRSRIRAVTEKTEVSGEKPSVAHVVWHDPLWVSGNGTFQNEVIAMAGGTNAFGSIEAWSIVSLEEFITTDPDYILVSSGSGMNRDDYDAVYDYIVNEPRLQKLNAIKNGHVYVIDADVISRGGPRIVDALEEVAGDLHPDLAVAPAPEATEPVRSPGFGAIPLICALSAAILLLQKR